MLRKGKLFNAIIILLLVGSVYSSNAWQYSYVYTEGLYRREGLYADTYGRYLVCFEEETYLSGDEFVTEGYWTPAIPVLNGGYGTYCFEIFEGKIRAVACDDNGTCSVGNWVHFKESGTTSASSRSIEVSNGKIRYCVSGKGCGDWITLDTSIINSNSCPSGYSLNSSTNKCEATPTITCPAGYTYNSSIKKCQANPVTSCPAN